MAIRTKKFWNKHIDEVVRAIQITEENLTEVVTHINRNGGAATGHLGDTRSKRPARIRIKQLNFGENWGKRDWRVARVGDWIVRVGEDDFYRVKDTYFQEAHTAA